MTDDLTLQLRIDTVSTYQTPINERSEVHVKLDGVLTGPADTLLSLLRARQQGRPIVRVVVLEIAPEDEV